MKIKDVTKLIEISFPLSNAAKWDSSGLQYSKKVKDIKNILVCLDITSEVINEAIEKDVNLIVSHHPFLFNENINKLKINYKVEIFKLLKKHKIAIYALHTSYDASPVGMNQKILIELGCKNVKSYKNNKFITYGKLTKQIKFDDLINILKKFFNIPTIQYTNYSKDKYVKRIGICTGAGGDLVSFIDRKNLDVFITGEMKWNSWIETQEKKINAIILNHYMENYFCKDILIFLEETFLNCGIKFLKYDIKNPINYG